MHREESIWENPQEFNPDRWSTLQKGAVVAMVEARVVCVMTLRWFDLQTAFTGEGPSIPGWGERAYQELQLTAKPKDGIPMKVKLRPHA